MILYYNSKNKGYARINRNQYLMTEAEGKMRNWGLRKDKMGYRFLRQKPVGNYILDFYCHKLKLGIEIDDNSHDWKGEYDEERTKYFNSVGIEIIRYTNNNIHYHLDAVIIDLESKTQERINNLGLE